MTPQRYITDRLAEGAKLTHVVGELAAITTASERTVWRWVKGSGVPTDAALKLISVWYRLTSQERQKAGL